MRVATSAEGVIKSAVSMFLRSPNAQARNNIRQAISVLKNRNGQHERTMRESKLSNKGVEIGPPHTNFRGILTGVPEFTGQQQTLVSTEGKDG